MLCTYLFLALQARLYRNVVLMTAKIENIEGVLTKQVNTKDVLKEENTFGLWKGLRPTFS